jgi:uncharacterized membrane protein YkoI
MKNTTIASIVFALTLFAVAGAGSSAAAQEKKPNAKLAKQAKITMEQAREIASKEAEGTIEEGELEKEHGKLVYSFDIRNSKGTITEVQVDARTGEIVSVEEEDAKAEAREKAKDKKHN